jgi:chemotaxis protein MotB
MTAQESRARKSWLLSFGDVTTLLICFFVMMIAVNKGEVARVHIWIESQLETSKQELQQLVDSQQIEGVKIGRDAQGVSITISRNDAFEPAKTEPSVALQERLLLIGQFLPQLAIFQVIERYPQMMIDAQSQNMYWLAEVVVEGHTDNDAIAANSRLRSNWELSALRALTVMQVLQSASQLPEAHFAVAGMGEYRPVSSNDSAMGKAENRRITIHINATLLKLSHNPNHANHENDHTPLVPASE